MIHKRSSGILLHITSLPGTNGIGDFGPDAYSFVDFLQKSGQSHWQILPLTFPHADSKWSPYNCISAFAGNTLLISLPLLYQSGLLKEDDLNDNVDESDRVDYKKATQIKYAGLEIAYQHFSSKNDKQVFHQFCNENYEWLDDFALFIALSEKYKTADWSNWPTELRDRHEDSLKNVQLSLKDRIEKERFWQYLFHQQWFSLKKYCNNKGISIIGDIPLYISYRSADVWAHQDIFKLDEHRKPEFLSGVPPDLFSDTGQLWRNPVYNWSRLKETGYLWWLQRLRHNLKLYDISRIDHFRGLVKYWQVPSTEETAINGEWKDGPQNDFFESVFKYFPTAPFIAEDLGYITSDVRELVQSLQLTGMNVLLFAFDDYNGENLYLPHNHTKNSIVYTGTHDNNTVKGWFQEDATDENKEILSLYLGKKLSLNTIHWDFIRLALSSVATLSIIPAQDILGLDSKSRMNRPAGSQENWCWKLRKGQLTEDLSKKLLQITRIYGRE